jgi:hypothetical protein
MLETARSSRKVGVKIASSRTRLTIISCLIRKKCDFKIIILLLSQENIFTIAKR